MIRLQRSFPSRERFVRTFVRRLSATGMEVELSARRPLPPGTLVELDLRLEDGAPLVVGLGEVAPAGTAEDGWQRIRFVELEEASRGELAGLVALGGPPAPASPQVDTRDPDETLESLVAGVFGGAERQPRAGDAVFVPPEPAAEPPPPAERPVPAVAPAPVSPPPGPGGEERPAPTGDGSQQPRRRPSLLQRLQVSPAVIVASVIAGATGAAADAWFEDLAAFFSELTSSHEDVMAPPTVDLMPVGVAPSRFDDSIDAGEPPAEAMAAAGPGPVVERSPPAGAGLPRGAETIPAAAELPTPTGAGAQPADRVRVITWDEAAGATVVTFWGNGAFLPERVVRFRVAGGTPRELVKLRGIDLPFPQAILDVGTPEVNRIRTGFHPQERVNELHLVLDLAGPDVVIDRMETGPESLRVHLRRRAAPAPEPAEERPARISS